MKRLFKSKPGIDPLPPPPPPPAPAAAGQQQVSTFPAVQSKRSSGNVLGENGGANGPSQAGYEHGHGHGHGHGHMHFGSHEHKPRHGVTPFPVDLGRDATPNGANPYIVNPAQPPLPPSQATIKPKSKGKERSSVPSSHTAPSLLEIQRMQAAQAEATERDSRRDQWLASQRMPPPPQPATSGMSHPVPHGNETPDGWTVVSPPMNPSQPHSGSPSTTPTQPNYYLPPGAKPPSPQPNQPALPSRDGTPTRPHYSHSQSSFSTNTPSYQQHANRPDMDPYTGAPPTRTRDRGYSSASGSMRGSDHEGSAQSHAQGPAVPGKLPKPAPPPQQARSPLANSYASPEITENAFPQPHPFTPPPSTAPQLAYPPQNRQPQAQLVDQMGAIRIEGPTPTDEDSTVGGKEKKKFWGMNRPSWTDRKDRSRPMTPDEGSRFIESFDDTSSVPPSNQGHGEETHRSNKLLGLDIGALRGKDKDHSHNNSISSVDNVSAAIQMACSSPEAPFSTSFEICERINHSSQPENVGKEAAHALRKQFKHGNEAERRAASNLWLIMMRNITVKGFRNHATSKKFLSPVETILLAPPSKPLVSISTRQVMLGIVADLTYNFGGEKGCEALVELWRKVKMPQDSDYGIPLPADHTAFIPDTFYGDPRNFQGGGDPYGRRDSRQGLYDDSSVPRPLPVHGTSPLHHGGPGYAALPDHGDDMRRLLEECTAAKEAARVLAEALVFTQPDELEEKPLILEFYRKCFLAHESLTHQMDWAQAEAVQSRERVLIQARMEGSDDEARGSTLEEEALATLLEVHGSLGDVLKQHDDLEKMARDEKEMREVRERSKKDTRMDRNNMLMPDNGASSSRSPSPAPHSRLPATSSSPVPPHGQLHDMSLPPPPPGRRSIDLAGRSRTPSPDRLPGPPKLSSSPGRSSPLSGGKARGPRPLPNPFARSDTHSALSSSLPKDDQMNASNHSHQSQHSQRGSSDHQPSRSGTGSTNDAAPVLTRNDNDEEDISANAHPSRKALGKRRAAPVDPDNNFDPDDMFGFSTNKKSSASSSSESLLADEAYVKPVTYAYDAYQEKLAAEAMSREGSSMGHDPKAGAKNASRQGSGNGDASGGGYASSGGAAGVLGGEGGGHRISVNSPVEAM